MSHIIYPVEIIISIKKGEHYEQDSVMLYLSKEENSMQAHALIRYLHACMVVGRKVIR